MDILSNESRDSLRSEARLLLGDGGSGDLLNLLALRELTVRWQVRTDWCVSQGGPFQGGGGPRFLQGPQNMDQRLLSSVSFSLLSSSLYLGSCCTCFMIFSGRMPL